MDEAHEHLTRCARQSIDSGRLPPHDSEAVWAGSGGAIYCCLCGTLIVSRQLRYIVERRGRTSEFHVQCFLAWEEESLNGPNGRDPQAAAPVDAE